MSLLALALVASAGCSAVSADLPSTTSPEQALVVSEQEPQQALEPSDAQAGDVVLLDAGAEPRAALRLDAQAGDVVRWEFTQHLDMRNTVAGQTEQVAFGFVLEFETRTLAVDAATGGIEQSSQVTSASLLGDFDPAATDSLSSSMVGYELWTKLDARGRMLDSECKQRCELDPTAGGIPGVAFPERPVGIGARWQQHDEVAVNGFSWLRIAEHELIAREGDEIEIETFVSLQPRDPSALQNGLLVTFEKVEFAGHFTTTLDMRSAASVRSQGSIEGDCKLSVSGRGRVTPMHMVISSDMSARLVD